MQVTRIRNRFWFISSHYHISVSSCWELIHTICAVYQAVDMDLIEGTLVGDEKQIYQVCETEQIDPSRFKIVHSESDIEAA